MALMNSDLITEIRELAEDFVRAERERLRTTSVPEAVRAPARARARGAGSAPRGAGRSPVDTHPST